MNKNVTTEELAGALKSISMNLIEKENQTIDEICLGIEFFELSDMPEGEDLMRAKLTVHGDVNKIYKKWQKEERKRRNSCF
jgi:hypothetical protein